MFSGSLNKTAETSHIWALPSYAMAFAPRVQVLVTGATSEPAGAPARAPAERLRRQLLRARAPEEAEARGEMEETNNRDFCCLFHKDFRVPVPSCFGPICWR